MDISKDRFVELERAEAKLSALEVSGVDNWSGYDDALINYARDNERVKRLDSLVDAVLVLVVDCALRNEDTAAKAEVLTLLTNNNVTFTDLEN